MRRVHTASGTRSPLRVRVRVRIGDEDGSTLPLAIFYGMLGLVLILLVVAATSLYLERKRLFTLADGAALVGAEAFALDDVSVSGARLRPTLDSAAVRAAVNGYLEENPVGRFESLGVRNAETIDGRSATVTLTASWRPPVLTLFVPAGFPLEVTAVARSVFG
ncbi:MAG: hypothetical protein JWP70_1306 [Leifsonia sp.]|nr:hypothetical protein [Leifsonia sp.]MDQ1588206.1 hypothetical protein [Microbacteriaceae bacterium]